MTLCMCHPKLRSALCEVFGNDVCSNIFSIESLKVLNHEEKTGMSMPL